MYLNVQGAVPKLCIRSRDSLSVALREGMAQSPHQLVPGRLLVQSSVGKLWPVSERAVQGKQQGAAWLCLADL